MYENNNILNLIRKEKIVAILRDISMEGFEKTLDILKEEGIKLLEITLNSKNIEKQFQILNDKYKKDFVIGAGTVVTMEGLKLALRNNVKFVLTPNVDEDILKELEKENILCICGIFTASEAIRAKRYKCCKMLKLFPASEVPFTYLKALKGPIEDLECMAVGGVNKNNIENFLRAGFSALGMGSSLIDNKLIENAKFEELQKNIHEIKKIIEDFI
ncbi:MAG: bifunctional 4-hydroxy-2-oxoglutarate aldolase/2-dehydro-3-deoxy-phosphogluconate aldolase [Fusobacteriaceae bacterium]|jgi:2-dehydro-3-deoxyphosphogluconate aldolase/(4S)-4-hydroxy-2-oxoglutarate aldolase|nr:bifunctional 4-hydroxy-2-oxoglutarate aldolase/2-dehydro-3-deoxy-phosphogluconate aldolase [Fusobacteriaceae bacterium]